MIGAILSLGAGAGCAPGIAELQQSWSKTKKRGVTVAAARDLSLSSGEVYYSTRRGTITPDSFQKMGPHEQSIVLKKLIVRRRLIAEGRAAGVYDSKEAQAYLLPRLEQILEEYQLDRLARAGTGTSGLPPEPVLAEYLRRRGKSPDLAGPVAEQLKERWTAARLARVRREATARILREQALRLHLETRSAQASRAERPGR